MDPRSGAPDVFVVQDDCFAPFPSRDGHLVMRFNTTVPFMEQDCGPLNGDFVPSLLFHMPDAQYEPAGEVNWSPDGGLRIFAKKPKREELSVQARWVICAQRWESLGKVMSKHRDAGSREREAPEKLSWRCSKEGGGQLWGLF